jgi:hypothetical protein
MEHAERKAGARRAQVRQMSLSPAGLANKTPDLRTKNGKCCQRVSFGANFLQTV